ncbi:MAG: bifunctional DNA primase/polymerase [Planctomycetota bacterium]
MTIYDAARQYADRGWSIIPMNMEAKTPRVRWKKYQRHHASESTLRRWFRDGDHGVGIVFGAVSGGLASRDFDEQHTYHRWAADYPVLAKELPTVETRRGFHVYCRAWPESVTEARKLLGKPTENTGALSVTDGELRAGIGCYSVLPPSVHPKGHVYRWLVPLPTGDLPTVNLCDVGFFDAESAKTAIPCDRERQSHQKPYMANVVEGDGGCGQLENEIENAIAATLPAVAGRRNDQVFKLCRWLKGIPAIADAKPLELEPYVREWHRRALPHIATKPFEETLIDFLRGWDNVKFPRGQDPMSVIVERAMNAPEPIEAAPFEQPQAKRLVAICRELQRAAGDGPFYLSCRTAGGLVGVDRQTAWRWLFLMEKTGLLVVVTRGSNSSMKATRYRFNSYDR